MARDSQEESAARLINSWILDHAYYTVLKEFVDKGEVSYSRDMVQGTVHMEKEDDTAVEAKVYLLLMMCKLVDGKDPNIEYFSDDDTRDGAILTALEDTLDIFESVVQLCRISHGEADVMKQFIKRQAVFVCCRDNNFENAQAVYSRLWKENNFRKYATEVQEEVETVLKSHNKNHRLLLEYSYDTFLDVCRKTINQIHMDNFQIPMLRKLADEELSKRRQKFTTDAVTQTMLAPHFSNVSISGAVFKQLVHDSKLPELAGKPFRLPENADRVWRSKLKSFGTRKSEPPVATECIESVVKLPSSEEEDEEQQISSPSKRSTKREKIVNEIDHKANSPRQVGFDHRSSSKSHSPRRASTLVQNEEKPTKTTRALFQNNKRRRHESEDSDVPAKLLKPPKSGRIDASSPTVSSSTPEKSFLKSMQSHKLRRNVGRIDRHATKMESEDSSAVESFSSEEEDLSKSKSNVKTTIKSPRAKRRALWSSKEEEQFYVAVQKCGIGNWAEMKVQYEFAGRTNVNLKDKWRQISRTKRLNQLKNKYGDI